MKRRSFLALLGLSTPAVLYDGLYDPSRLLWTAPAPRLPPVVAQCATMHLARLATDVAEIIAQRLPRVVEVRQTLPATGPTGERMWGVSGAADPQDVQLQLAARDWWREAFAAPMAAALVDYMHRHDVRYVRQPLEIADPGLEVVIARAGGIVVRGTRDWVPPFDGRLPPGLAAVSTGRHQFRFDLIGGRA